LLHVGTQKNSPSSSSPQRPEQLVRRQRAARVAVGANAFGRRGGGVARAFGGFQGHLGGDPVVMTQEQLGIPKSPWLP